MRRLPVLIVAAVAFAGGLFAAATAMSLQGQAQPGSGFAAVPGERGGSDLTGPYEAVADWPKPLSQLPGHDQWTWGATEAVFAETANRVFAIHLGELPKLQRPPVRALPEIGPSLSFPVGEVPFRHASQGQFASPPGGGGPGADPDDPAVQYKGRPGVDSRWEHLVLVYNAAGDIVEQWTQWDKMLRRPHGVHISPYDPEKHVWIVDDHNDVLYKFTHDGKQLVQTIGTKGKRGQDPTHFDRPTFMAFSPDGSIFVSDGYNGHSVVKLDKNGKYVTSWGMAGQPGGKETRPNYFNVVHGIAADPVTRRIYVSDRGNRRIQVFDENGKYVDQWPVGPQAQVQYLIANGDGGVWAFEDPAKVTKYDREGHLLYAWGSIGDYPGGFLNVHSASVDPDGNLYTAEVGNARVQKFRPRAGARPEFLVGKPPVPR